MLYYSDQREESVVACTSGNANSLELVTPLQKLPERRAPMAVPRLLFRAKLGKRLLNLRKIKQRIISEPTLPARRIENHSLGGPAKSRESLPITRHRQHAHEPSRALLRRKLPKFPQHAGVIGLVIRILAGQMWLIRGIPRRMHPRRPIQRIY